MHAFDFEISRLPSETIHLVGVVGDRILIFITDYEGVRIRSATSEFSPEPNRYERNEMSTIGPDQFMQGLRRFLQRRAEQLEIRTYTPQVSLIPLIKLEPNVGMIIAAYADGHVLRLSWDGTLVWTRSAEQRIQALAIDPQQRRVIIAVAGSLSMLSSEDGSVSSSIPVAGEFLDTRIVSIEWKSILMIAYSSGMIEIMTSSFDKLSRIDAGNPIHSAALENDCSLIAACTFDCVDVYSVRSSQKLISIRSTEPHGLFNWVTWMPSHGDNRLAVAVGSTIQQVVLKDPKSICCFDERYVACMEPNRVIIYGHESVSTITFPIDQEVKSVIGNPSRGFCVLSLSTSTDSIIKFLDRMGQEIMQHRILEGSTSIRAYDYTETITVCTDGIFVVLLVADGSQSWISIHSPIESKAGIPPLSSTDPKSEEDIIVDMILDSSESLVIARKSGIVQLYGIDEGCMRLVRSVRAVASFSPKKILLSTSRAILLDEVSRSFIGTKDFQSMKPLQYRSVCWKIIVCSTDDLFAVADCDSVFVYKTSSSGALSLLDAIQVGLDYEIVAIYNSEICFFNWRNKQVTWIPLRYIRDWDVLAKPSAPTGALVEFVHANPCKRLWNALGALLIRREDYREAKECFVQTNDWLGTVLVEGLENGTYSKEVDFYNEETNTAKMAPESSEYPEWSVASNCMDSNGSCDWKSFSDAGIEMLCDSLLREHEDDSLIAVLGRINSEIGGSACQNQVSDYLHYLVLSGNPEAAIRISLSMKDIAKAVQLANEYNYWGMLAAALETMPPQTWQKPSQESIELLLAHIPSTNVTSEVARCLVALARRCEDETAIVMLGFVRSHKHILVRYYCDLLSLRLRKLHPDETFNTSMRYINAHIALYSGDYEEAHSQVFSMSMTGERNNLCIEVLSLWALRALASILLGKRCECSSAFSTLQTKPSIWESDREKFRQLSFKVFNCGQNEENM